MPRKITSSGEATQQRRTSERRALGGESGPARRKQMRGPAPADGGKWAGSGRKTVSHHEGPAIVREPQPGRGPKTRKAMRKGTANHPNHG